MNRELKGLEEDLDYIESILLVCAYLPENVDNIQKEESFLLTEAYTRLREMREKVKVM